MADSLDVFTGILLTVIGLVLVYGSIAYRLIDLILIIGVLIAIFGICKLLLVFVRRNLNSNRRGSRKNLNHRSNSTYDRVIEGAKEVENIVNAKLDGNNSSSKSVLNSHESRSNGLDQATATLDDFLSSSKPKERELKYETPIDESKQVLKAKPVEEEKPKFKLPSIRKSNKPKKRSFGYLRDNQEESNPDTVYFTPNYEKPMKVTRRPKKKVRDSINLSLAPKRSREISKALASVGDAETVYDNEVSDESYSLMPKTMDEEIIMPIDEIALDEIIEQPIYNLSQSENTLYNNVIYDEAGVDDVITPIYADEEYRQEYGISDDYAVEYPVSEIEEDIPQDDLDYITPEVSEDADSLPRPTSIASTNPIASKKDINAYLTRPHRKSEVLDIPKPRAKPVEAKAATTQAVPKPRVKAEIPSVASIESEIPRVSSIESEIPRVSSIESEIPRVSSIENELSSPSSIESEIPRPAPKVNVLDVENDGEIPSLSDLIDTPEETITIDPNDPESLPIPKLLNSYVICEKGILTSQEAFEEVASHSKEEILLEAPTIKDMGDRFLSNLSKIKSRVIIEEFDLEDISYVLLLSSLIKKGVEIKTLPSLDSFNLIGDTSHALIISNSVDEDDFEYGAVYDDRESVENIKELFESSWKLAKDLDISSS